MEIEKYSKEITELANKNERRRIIIDLLKTKKETYTYNEVTEIILAPEN